LVKRARFCLTAVRLMMEFDKYPWDTQKQRG
jgi:hypothetical protein